jgi:hypothetical protein
MKLFKLIVYFSCFKVSFAFSQKSNDNLKTNYSNNAVFTIASSASIYSKVSLRITDDEVDRKQSSPPINISYDFASRSKFTLGIALYYENFQFFKPNPNASVFLNRNKNLAFSGDLSKKDISFNLINPSIRLLYHKIKNDNDLYAGVRVGYDIFTNVSLPNPKFSKLIKNKSTTQLLMGYRKYVNNWGFNIEGAVGRPFWFLGGVNYKIIKK